MLNMRTAIEFRLCVSRTCDLVRAARGRRGDVPRRLKLYYGSTLPLLYKAVGLLSYGEWPVMCVKGCFLSLSLISFSRSACSLLSSRLSPPHIPQTTLLQVPEILDSHRISHMHTEVTASHSQDRPHFSVAYPLGRCVCPLLRTSLSAEILTQPTSDRAHLSTPAHTPERSFRI